VRITRIGHEDSGTLPLLPDVTGLPARLKAIPGFADSWDDWKAYRRKIKKPLTGKSVREQLMFLSEQADPIAVIRQSIRCGWQGLFRIRGQEDDAESLVLEGAAIDFKMFSTLMEGLEATFGRPACKRQRTEYYRLLSQNPAPLLVPVFDLAKHESKFFPTPKVLFEIMARFKSKLRDRSTTQQPHVQIECECGTSFSVRSQDLHGGGFFVCPGSMAKNFHCGKRYSVEQIRAICHQK